MDQNEAKRFPAVYICYCCSLFEKKLFATTDRAKAHDWLSAAHGSLTHDGFTPNFPRNTLQSKVLSGLAEGREGEVRMVKQGHIGSTICDLGVKFQYGEEEK